VITTLPPATPVTTPLPDPTIAIAGFPLLHKPPGVASVSSAVNPAHTSAVPPIEAGNGFTVTIVVVIQPVGNVYDTTAVPALKPVTVPPVSDTAIIVYSVDHVPPPASLSVIDEPTHKGTFPEIASGKGFTVIVVVVIQPVGNVYVIVAVPVALPVTTPDGDTEAVAPDELAHVPPAVASLSAVVSPTHTFMVPVMPAGKGFTVTTAMLVQPVGSI